MGSIPGYYVGVGLLLTFVGLVFALYNAAEAAGANDAQAMQNATRNLLHVATFKFATSIAGLAASILLSFIFRLYTIAMEDAFESFDYALQRRVSYLPPQKIAVEMSARMDEQVTQLKEINSERFFSRMGEQMSPRIQEAMATAVAPMGASINEAIAQISGNSQSGVKDLIKEFGKTVQLGAGQELRSLADTLKELQTTLADARSGIDGSGQDFGRRMSEAADHLGRLVKQAAGRLDQSSGKSQEALVDIVNALRDTNEKAQQSVREASTTAASHLDGILGKVDGRIAEQARSLQTSFAEFQSRLIEQLDESIKRTAEPQTRRPILRRRSEPRRRRPLKALTRALKAHSRTSTEKSPNLSPR